MLTITLQLPSATADMRVRKTNLGTWYCLNDLAKAAFGDDVPQKLAPSYWRRTASAAKLIDRHGGTAFVEQKGAALIQLKGRAGTWATDPIAFQYATELDPELGLAFDEAINPSARPAQTAKPAAVEKPSLPLHDFARYEPPSQPSTAAQTPSQPSTAPSTQAPTPVVERPILEPSHRPLPCPAARPSLPWAYEPCYQSPQRALRALKRAGLPLPEPINPVPRPTEPYPTFPYEVEDFDEAEPWEMSWDEEHALLWAQERESDVIEAEIARAQERERQLREGPEWTLWYTEAERKLYG